MGKSITGMTSKIIGAVIILVALIMINTIYPANIAISTALTTATNSASFIILGDIIPFGTLIIIFGLLFTGGLLFWKGESMNASVKYMVAVILSIVTLIVLLKIFPSFITALDDNITTAKAASDSIGELFFGGILPLVLYIVMILGTAVLSGVKYARSRRGRKKNKALQGAF